MNKTVSINLGGFFLYLDEDAFHLLTQYLESIKISLSNSESQEEICKDIEMRIAELLFEKKSNDKQVVTKLEIENIIAILGQPNDFRIENGETDESSSNTTSQKESFNTIRKTQKLYRDGEHSTIGGVAAGLGHYFGVDKIWFRILFLIFIFAGFGTGIIIYIILWAVTPEARTTSEKLEMCGEPITISNIEKKVQAEFEGISKRIKETNYQELGERVKTGAHKIKPVLFKVANIFIKLVALFFITIAILTLIALLGIVFAFGTTSFLELPGQEYINAFNYTAIPSVGIGIVNFLAFGIPFIFLMVLGIRLLTDNRKRMGKIAKYSLLSIWILSILSLIGIGIVEVSEISFSGKSIANTTLNLQPKDTLYVSFKHNDFYSKDTENEESFKITNDAQNQPIIYSNDIKIHVLKTDKLAPYLKIEKQALGKNYIQAKHFADQISYNYTITGNRLILDNYFTSNVKNKFRDQEIEIYLYLPEGIMVAPDANVAHYITSDDADFDFKFENEDEIYKVSSSYLDCINCEEDVQNDSLHIKKTVLLKIGGKEILRTETQSRTNK